MFIAINYFISACLLLSIFYKSISLNLFTFFLALFVLSLVYQIFSTNIKDSKTCLRSFKFNNVSGLILFMESYQLIIHNEFIRIKINFKKTL